MNRRSFFKRLVVAGAAFTILPGAGRVWKAVRAEPFSMQEMFGTLYDIKRQREQQPGYDPNVIEFWCRTEHAPAFMSACEAYFRQSIAA